MKTIYDFTGARVRSLMGVLGVYKPPRKAPALIEFEKDGYIHVRVLANKADWVSAMCMYAANDTLDGKMKVAQDGKATFLFDRNGCMKACSYPEPWDIYDADVGLAVAYAKWRNWKIPDYI